MTHSPNPHAGPAQDRSPRPAESAADQSTAVNGTAQTATHPPAPAPQPADQPAPTRRPWKLLVLVLLLAALGGGVWYVLAHTDDAPEPLVLQGNIDVRQVNLSFKVDGRIDRLLVDEGDTVKAGQLLAQLDQRYFRDDLRVARAARDNLAAVLARLEHGSRPEEIQQARAQVRLQEATLDRARRDLARAERLVPRGAMSQSELDQDAASVKVAEANVRYAREALRLAEIGPRKEDIAAARAQLAQQNAAIIQSERRLADSDLVAPSNGTILTRAQERGAVVQAGTTVFTLTLTSPVWVRTYVNERDLGMIHPGMEAQVFTDTAPDRPYVGHIGFISPTAEFTPKTVETRELRTDLVYRLRVVVDNPDGGLRQGMPVSVRLPVTSARRKTFWQRVRAVLHLDGK